MTRILALFFVPTFGLAVAEAATVEFQVLDNKGEHLPCRIHVKDQAGKPQRAEELPFWQDHFVCPGVAKLRLPPGKYQYEIERGPEYKRHQGSFEVAAKEDEKTLAVGLTRLVDLASQGWWSGELHVHRALEETPLHLRAEDLHVAPVITWWNGRNLWDRREVPKETVVRLDGNRYYTLMAGEDEREGGALLYFGLKKPLPLPGGKREFPEHPSPMKFVAAAREQPGAWIDIEKPFWWDVPVWLASGQIDSIGLANNHMCRSRMYESEAWGKPRDTKRLPLPRGNGFWTQEIYYHVLNSGLRIPPSAGSASGVLPNPVGYNRVYVHLGKELSYPDWWKGFKAGRSFVTNGPLLLCKANDKLPGTVFTAKGGNEVQIALDIELISNDAVPALEIIQDGEVAQRIPLKDGRRAHVQHSMTFQRSGWFLIRAIAENTNTFRFASTAPYYVEIGDTKRRIDMRSVQFFLDWVDERRKRVPLQLKDPAKLREVLQHHDQARRFWQQRLK